MTIEEILYNQDISVRSFNVCNDNDLKDLSDILDHYYEYRTFDKLRKCGRKSNEELTALCLKHLDFNRLHCAGTLLPENKLISKIINLTRTQREIVNNFIEINVNNLSNKSKNSITTFLNGNFKIRNINEKIISNQGFNFKDIKNVGTKTEKELKRFLASIKTFIEKVASVEEEIELVSMKNKFFIEKTFSIFSIPNEILESQSIFNLVDFLIKKDAIFEKNENIIFKKAFKIYDNQKEHTLDEIAEEIKITRERVRQIRKGILEKLFNNLQFLKNIEDDLFQKYCIDKNQNFINIDNNINKQINEVNSTDFSIEFNIILIYVYMSDKFELIGEIEDVLQPKFFNSRERYNWGNFYLVNKKISNLFNFIDFANDLEKRTSKNLEESYNFNFKSYLLNFSASTNLYELNDIAEVAEKILNNEFGIILDLNDDLVFERSKKIQIYEYAYEALKQLDKPSFVSEIKEKIVDLYPDIEIEEAKVSTSLKREHGFVPIERKSLFGLKIWEKEKENFKGGTIKEVIYDFLKDKTRPQHILKITEYIKKMRENKDQRSIITNLKLDPLKRFIFFNQNFIGIKENNNIYTDNFKNIPIQLGKNIISKFKNGFTINDINQFLQDEYELNYEESNDVINNLKYFNEN
jgi:hypothetical protein